MHLHQRRVDVQHHRSGPRRVAAAFPHSAAHTGHSPSEGLHHIGAQTTQRAIQSRVRRHIAEQHRLGPQMLDVAARLPAARELNNACTNTLPRSWTGAPLTARRHRRRQSLPQPQSVSETPQNEQTPMRRDLIAASCHPHIASAATVHLGDAPSSGSDELCATRIIPHRRGFSADANPINPKTRERSGLEPSPAPPSAVLSVDHDTRLILVASTKPATSPLSAAAAPTWPPAIETAAQTNPAAIVVITDGYTGWPPAPPPGVRKVIAALTRNGWLNRVPGWIQAIDITPRSERHT